MQQQSKFSAVGFTLIELLVVIAVIAVLAALLFPVFAPSAGQRQAGGLYEQSAPGRHGAEHVRHRQR